MLRIPEGKNISRWYSDLETSGCGVNKDSSLCKMRKSTLYTYILFLIFLTVGHSKEFSTSRIVKERCRRNIWQLSSTWSNYKKKATKHEFKAQAIVDLTINHSRHCKVQRSVWYCFLKQHCAEGSFESRPLTMPTGKPDMLATRETIQQTNTALWSARPTDGFQMKMSSIAQVCEGNNNVDRIFVWCKIKWKAGSKVGETGLWLEYCRWLNPNRKSRWLTICYLNRHSQSAFVQYLIPKLRVKVVSERKGAKNQLVVVK